MSSITFEEFSQLDQLKAVFCCQECKNCVKHGNGKGWHCHFNPLRTRKIDVPIGQNIPRWCPIMPQK